MGGFVQSWLEANGLEADEWSRQLGSTKVESRLVWFAQMNNEVEP